MAKAVKKARKSSSTAGKVLKAVAALLPHKKATKKAKSNSKTKSASSKRSRASAKSKSRSTPSKSKSVSAASKGKSASSSSTSRSNSGAKSKVANAQSYADTLRAIAKKKKMTAKPGKDPAHAPGHRKIKIQGLKKSRSKGKSLNNSVMIANSKADRIHQTESEQRRLIPGASIERKGRR